MTRAEDARTSGKQAKKTGLNVWSILPFAVFFIAFSLIPRFAAEKQITTLIYVGINVLLALGLNLLMGYAGQISLGHAAFFGLGAYASAILTVRPVPTEVIPGFAAGVGVMVGAAVLISLTRIAGCKLAAGVAALILLSWIVRLAHAPFVAGIAIFAVAMALLGLAVRIGWWKAAISGVAAIAGTAVCRSFLAGVLERGGTSPWSGMLTGMLITALIAYLIGGQVLRLKGHYLAMATLGFGVIVEIVFRQWTDVTGGSSDGIFGIPGIQVMDSFPRWLGGFFRTAAGHKLDMRQEYYYLVWGIVFIALILATNIVRSRVGRAMRAVHGSEVAAESLGVDTARYKVQVFVLSAVFASIAGSLHAHNAGIGYINPGDFSFTVSVQLLVMVVVGGMASVWGALFGAAAIQVLKNWLLTIEKTDVQLWGLTLKGLDPIVFGAVLIVVMIVLPQGVVRGLADVVGVSMRAVLRNSSRDAKHSE